MADVPADRDDQELILSAQAGLATLSESFVRCRGCTESEESDGADSRVLKPESLLVNAMRALGGVKRLQLVANIRSNMATTTAGALWNERREYQRAEDVLESDEMWAG